MGCRVSVLPPTTTTLPHVPEYFKLVSASSGARRHGSSTPPTLDDDREWLLVFHNHSDRYNAALVTTDGYTPITIAYPLVPADPTASIPQVLTTSFASADGAAAGSIDLVLSSKGGSLCGSSQAAAALASATITWGSRSYSVADPPPSVARQLRGIAE